MAGVFGAILNAKTARRQFIGSMVWGMGLALYEDTVMDERLGRIVNNNLAEYHDPQRSIAGTSAWTGICGSAAAVANAVFHATGKRVRAYPITLDKLL
jgi:xanthine dehydrogenase YagR molybdenum-binding subunit